MGHTCGGLVTTCEIQFSPPACGSQESNSSCQPWQRASLPSEPSCRLLLTLSVFARERRSSDPHSRVCLASLDPEDPLSSYINANYIRGYSGKEKVYIATQGPIVSTVADFWRMVWQEHTPIIVMITNIEEMNEKCTEYWPEEQVVHDGVEITVQKVIHTEDYRLRLISLRRGTEERGLKHYWFTSWPDQKTPDRAPPLLHLVREVEEAAQQEGPHCSPIIVHCSAGIGRTGCFIATSICCQQLRREGIVDILKTTCQLRQDRGGMIQTCEQYQFVHHVMSLYEKQLSHQSPE